MRYPPTQDGGEWWHEMASNFVLQRTAGSRCSPFGR
jgi:hypothetical protein